MKTCKDCICLDRCKELYDSFGLFINLEESVTCKHFKDKSKFIEKPFNIRDYVYVITKCSYSSPYEIIKCMVTKIRLKDCSTVTFSCEGHYANNWRYVSGNFKTTSIGKTVFLTLEEAEKKLEELK